MDTAPLFAPWRMEYIRALDKSGEGCFLCQAAAADSGKRRELLVLWVTDLSIVLMNRYPYANGHLLIAPRESLPAGAKSARRNLPATLHRSCPTGYARRSRAH